MAPALRYLRAWSLATVGLLALVAAFNMVVDPYGVFLLVDADGFNHIKSQAGQRAETFKRHAVERIRPNALILGNSRAEIGFDPGSAQWPPALRPVFNLALPGAGVDSALDEFTHALDASTPRFVLMGLDFLDFRVDAMARDEPATRATRTPRWREYLSVLLTSSALFDSIATIGAQRRQFPASLTGTGFNPMLDYVAIARNEGYYAMFRQRDQENAAAYRRGTTTIYRPDGRLAPEFDIVEKIITLCAERRVALRFVIYPYHAHTLVLFEQSGLWPAFEAWKRELANRVDHSAAGNDVELWDFSGFSAYSEEEVPRPGDTTAEMRWYWEGGHFKKSLGDVMLARLFDANSQDAWGQRLTAANVQEQLQRQRQAADVYKRSHTHDVDALARIVAAVADVHQSNPRAAPGPGGNGKPPSATAIE